MRNPVRPMLRCLPFLPEVRPPGPWAAFRACLPQSCNLHLIILADTQPVPTNYLYGTEQAESRLVPLQAWTHRQKVKRVQTRLLSMLHSLAKEVQGR